MRGVLLTGHGGPEKLAYREDLAAPKPGPGEVLIEVAACGMNNTDINTRIGWYSQRVTSSTSDAPAAEAGTDGSWGGRMKFPRIQGADPVGRIVAVGSQVPVQRVGQRVLIDAWIRHPSGALELAEYLGSERDGGYAELVAVPSSNAHPIESDLSDTELASFPCSYATAEHMLERAGVAAGQLVVVTGASGGVGSGLIQLAKRRGAKVVAIAGRDKLDGVKDIGADVVVARQDPDPARSVLEAVGPVDVVADVVAGPLFPRLLEIIKRGGHYTTAGAIGGPIVELDLRTLYLHDLTLHGATVLPQQVFTNLVGYIEAAEIRPVVAATFPLEALAKAQEFFLKKEHIGAVVVEIG